MRQLLRGFSIIHFILFLAESELLCKVWEGGVWMVTCWRAAHSTSCDLALLISGLVSFPLFRGRHSGWFKSSCSRLLKAGSHRRSSLLLILGILGQTKRAISDAFARIHGHLTAQPSSSHRPLPLQLFILFGDQSLSFFFYSSGFLIHLFTSYHRSLNKGRICGPGGSFRLHVAHLLFL